MEQYRTRRRRRASGLPSQRHCLVRHGLSYVLRLRPKRYSGPRRRNRRFPAPLPWLPRERHIQRRPEMPNRARMARICPSCIFGGRMVIESDSDYRWPDGPNLQLRRSMWGAGSVPSCSAIETAPDFRRWQRRRSPCEGGVLFVDETLVPIYSRQPLRYSEHVSDLMPD